MLILTKALSNPLVLEAFEKLLVSGLVWGSKVLTENYIDYRAKEEVQKILRKRKRKKI